MKKNNLQTKNKIEKIEMQNRHRDNWKKKKINTTQQINIYIEESLKKKKEGRKERKKRIEVLILGWFS